MKFFKLKDEFIKHTAVMFIGISLFNLCNLFYHLFMIRYLLPVEYGHLNSLMTLFMIISVPAATIQTSVTKFVSSFKTQKKYDQIRELLRHLLLLMSSVGFSVFLLATLGSSFISSFLQISSQGLILLLGITLFFAMMLPVPWGGLQGLQKFGSLAFNLILNGGIKLVLGILFVLLGLGILGAMGAITVSYCITILIALIMVKYYVPKEKAVFHKEKNPEVSDRLYISEVYKYFLPVGITLLCFLLLTNIDLILVKHLFSPIEAGFYSIAQMVGKIILFLPIPLIAVMFPKLSSLSGQEETGHLILKKGLIIAASLCSGAVILGLFFPSWIIKILSGKIYLECIPLVRLFCINMSFFSLVLITLYYHLSTHNRFYIYPLFFLTLIQTGLIILFHETLTQVLVVVAVVAFILFWTNLYLIYHPYKRRRQDL